MAVKAAKVKPAKAKKSKSKTSYDPSLLVFDAGKQWIDRDIQESWEVHEWRHATTILKHDFPGEWKEIQEVLRNFKLKYSDVIEGGGNESGVTKLINGRFVDKHKWEVRKFATAIVVDDSRTDSPTHEVDCFKNKIAIETEWNNKDPFFDRDLNNFRLLFELRVIDVGIIITRRDELQALMNSLGRGGSYGASTTHMSKLLPKIEGGGAGGCPVLIFGIALATYEDDSDHKDHPAPKPEVAAAVAAEVKAADAAEGKSTQR